MNFYENLRTFDVSNFSKESLTQTCDNDGELSKDAYRAMGISRPGQGRLRVAILLANHYGRAEDGGCEDCPGISVQVSMILARLAGYRIKRISNATQLKGCNLLVVPQALFELPSQFFLTSAGDVKFSLEAEVFARCIVEAVNMGIPVLAIGNSALLLAGMGGLKLCRREDIETPFDHTNMEHALEVVEDTVFYGLNNLKVHSQHSAFVAPPKVQREELRLGADEALPLWAFARDGMPEGIGDFEHGIIGVSWLPNFYESEEQMMILAWLCNKAEEM